MHTSSLTLMLVNSHPASAVCPWLKQDRSHFSFQLEYETVIRLDHCDLPIKDSLGAAVASSHLGCNH